MDDLQVPFSSPASMGGKGVGTSPKTLLISAVTACCSLTLLAYLRKRRLPFTDLRIVTEGIVSGHPRELKFEKIVVSPVFRGGSREQAGEYRGTAAEARDHCFIGQTVAAGGVAYELGTVTIE